MYRHDPQNTGRSKYSGPAIGEIYKQIKALNMECVPVIGEDSILFFATSQPGYLYAYKNYDSIYSFQIGFEVHTSPVIDNQNNIYIFSDPNLKKISSSGELVWSLDLSPGTLSSSLSMDRAGNIYLIGGDKTVKCITKDGIIRWSYNESRLMVNTYHSPAISPDGNTIYLQGETVSLIALDLKTQQEKWVFGSNPLQGAPMVDCEGNIYIIPSNKGTHKLTLYSLTPEGNIRWQYQYYSKFASNTEEAAIDKNGNIYFGYEDTLFSVNYEGELNWKKFVGSNSYTSSKILDDQGNIFFTSWTNSDVNKVLCYNSNGEMCWELPLQNQYALYPPVLNNDGKLIIASIISEFLYVIR
jgi:outer membrane protein assembly factor BamB